MTTPRRSTDRRRAEELRRRAAELRDEAEQLEAEARQCGLLTGNELSRLPRKRAKIRVDQWDVLLTETLDDYGESCPTWNVDVYECDRYVGSYAWDAAARSIGRWRSGVIWSEYFQAAVSDRLRGELDGSA